MPLSREMATRSPVPRLTPESIADDQEPQGRLPKRVASGSGLPTVWTEAMSREVAFCDGYGELDHKITIRRLKTKFPVLMPHVITAGSIARQVEHLENRMNFAQWFKAGNEERLKELEARGIRIPEFDINRIPLPTQPRMLSDEEIFGSSAPMTGALAPGAYNGQELLPARMVKPAIAGSEISEKADNVQNKRQIQIGGERRDPRLLADVTNAGRNPGLIPFGGPYSMGAPSSSGSPRLENQRPQTIQERRAAKRMAMQK